MYAKKRTRFVYCYWLVYFKADNLYNGRDMYRSVFRMGFPRQGWSSRRFRQYRTYDCEKECSRPWMRAPLSAGLSRRNSENR